MIRCVRERALEAMWWIEGDAQIEGEEAMILGRNHKSELRL